MSEPRQIGDGLEQIQAIINRKRAPASAAPTAETAAPSLITTSEAKPAVPDEAASLNSLKRPAARVPPGQRGQLQAAKEIAKLRGDVTEKKPISYYTPILIQCTLPHKDPKAPAWARKNGNFSLVISSGFDEDANPYGIPYGAFPRLVLAYIISRVMAEPDLLKIKLSAHFSSFLKEVGYTGNHKGNSIAGKRVRDQMMRLFNATIAFRYDEKAEGYWHDAARQMLIAPSFDLWWDFKQPKQGSLFDSWIEISKEFRNAILDKPVPLRTDILKELRRSVMALDAYMWLSYRLFAMHEAKEQDLFVPYGALQNQFGTNYGEDSYRQFRSDLRSAFTKVATLWHHGSGAQPDKSLLKYEFNEDGLHLYLSPLLIGRGDRLNNHQKAQAILERRQFDAETLRKARYHSGKWNIERLQADFFQWIDDKAIQVTDPTALFIDFVKAHVKRNP